MWFTSLHAIRGVAALAVLALHGYWTWSLAFEPAVRAMYLCVDLFFILSGFVICVTYNGFFKGPSELLRFMKKRVVRLAPVYLVSGAFWLIAFLSLYALKHTPIAVADAALAAARYVFAVDYLYTGELFRVNPVAWSIMVELGAYLVFGIVWTLVADARLRLALAAMMACAGLMWLLQHTASLNLVTGPEALIRCLSGYFVGVTICMTMQLGGRRGLAALAAVIAAAWLAAQWVPAQRDVQVFLALALLMLSLVMWDARIKVPRPLVWLGDVSYSLYMWHFVISVIVAKVLFALAHEARFVLHDGERFVQVSPLAAALASGAYLVCSLGCAYLSYRILERKDLSLRWRWARPAAKADAQS